MRADAMRNMMMLAKAGIGPISKAVALAAGEGYVEHAALVDALMAAGYAIKNPRKPGQRHGAWVEIRDGIGKLCGYAFSYSVEDALRQACYAEIKTKAAIMAAR